MNKLVISSGFLSGKILLTMKFIVIFMLASIFNSFAAGYAQNEKLTVKTRNATLKEVISLIEKQSDYVFFYKNEEVNQSQRFNLDVNEKSVKEILDLMTNNASLSYSISENYIFLNRREAPKKAEELQQPQQQGKTVTGTIIDGNGEPVIGATVVVQGDATKGTVTDIDGNYILTNVPENATLVVSYVGMQTQNIPLSGRSSVNLTLQEDSELLDEVVVVGFGTQRKVNLTGAVASVDTKTLESRPVSSAVQALQGVVPGLNINVSNQGNRLDANPSMNIRGTGNLGTGSSASPLVLIDGVEGSLNNINPQDIASISVLKDAASAAIYGSRAPFGVVLVTTKSGEKGKVTTTYSNNFRWTRPTNIPDMLDSYRFAQYFNVGQANAGRTNPLFPDDIMQNIKDYMDGKITDTAPRNERQGPNAFPFNMRSNDNQNWPRNFIDKTSFAQEHNVGVSGGGDRMRYYVSGAFLTQDGQMNFSEERKNRYNVSGKVTADVTSWLSIDFNSRFIREDITMPSFLKVYGDRFFAETTKLYPMMPLYDNNGHYTRNPKLMQLDYGGRSNSQSNTYFTQGGFTLKPIKGMGIYGQAALRTISDQLGYAINKVYLYDRDNQPVEEAWLGGDPDLAAGKTSFESTSTQSSLITTSLYGDYEFAYGLNNFKAMLGVNSESFINNYLMGKRFDLIDENIPSINTSTGISTNAGSRNHWATMGYFGRLNYDYDGKYLVEFNLRRDGTSRFRGEKRWGLFPSFSLGWNMARESFWQPLEQYVNTFKPRFSYGSLGNQNTDNWYPTYSLQKITVGTPDVGGRWLLGDGSSKSNIATSPALVSSLLTWERITSYNYGLDFGASRNRLTGYFDYFVRNTDDMVGPAEELPPIVGASAPRTNNTSIQTKGWELQVSWRDRIGDFGYNATFNLSDSRTWVTKYPNPGKNLTYVDENGSTKDNLLER